MFGSETANARICPKTGQPLHAAVAPEPGELTFGVIASALLGVGDCRGEIPLASEMAGGLAVADRFKRFGLRIVAGGKQGLNLFQQATGKHLLDAQVDLGVESVPGRVEPQEQ